MNEECMYEMMNEERTRGPIGCACLGLKEGKRRGRESVFCFEIAFRTYPIDRK